MTRRLIDLTGRTFGQLSVVKRAGSTKSGSPTWEVVCNCGKTLVVDGSGLRRGATTSCGCISKEKLVTANLIDLTGKSFGFLLVLYHLGKDKHNRHQWRCRCTCGVEKDIDGRHLRAGNIKSCGCKRGEFIQTSRLIREEGKRYGRLVVLELGDGAKWKCKCDCGNNCLVEGHSLRTGKVVSCGCHKNELAARRLRKLKGPLNHSYNPAISDEDREAKRISPEYNFWRLSIYKRDSFSCQMCTSHRKIHAHHLDGWGDFKERRYDLDNGITLCQTCHNRFHSVFGRVGITKGMFSEWAKTYKDDPERLELLEEEKHRRARFKNGQTRSETLEPKIIGLWQEGLNDIEISKRVGLCSATISRWRKKVGIQSNARISHKKLGS